MATIKKATCVMKGERSGDKRFDLGYDLEIGSLRIDVVSVIKQRRANPVSP